MTSPLIPYNVSGSDLDTLKGELNSVLADIARQFAARDSAVAASTSVYADDVGELNAYTINPSPAITGLTKGMRFRFKAATSNTSTTPTLNVSGIGAVTVVRRDDDALATNDIKVDEIITVDYDGTNFQLLTDPLSPLTVSDGNFAVADGTTWVAESGDTARTSLGLGTGDSPTFAGLVVEGAAPNIRLTDTGTGGDTQINADNATGSITIGADTNDELDNTIVQLKVDGNQVFRVNENGVVLLGVSGSPGTAAGVFHVDTDGSVYLAGGQSSSSGSNVLLFGPSHTSNANDVIIRAGTDQLFTWDDSASTLTLGGGSSHGAVLTFNSDKKGTFPGDLDGGVTSTDGSASRTLANRANEVYNVLDFGAVADYDPTARTGTDDTTAFNTVWSTMAGTNDEPVILAGHQPTYVTKTIVIPPGFYRIDGSINWADTRRYNVNVIAHGAVLFGRVSNKPVVDMLGSRFVSVEGLHIHGDSTSVPRCGLQVGRYNGTAIGNNRFVDVQTDGEFQLAGCYNVASETTRWDRCRFSNSYNANDSFAYVGDGRNHWTVASDHVTVALSAPEELSFTNNYYGSCEFRHWGGHDAVWLAKTRGHDFDSGCYFQTWDKSAIRLYLLDHATPASISTHLDLSISGLFETSSTTGGYVDIVTTGSITLTEGVPVTQLVSGATGTPVKTVTGTNHRLSVPSAGWDTTNEISGKGASSVPSTVTYNAGMVSAIEFEGDGSGDNVDIEGFTFRPRNVQADSEIFKFTSIGTVTLQNADIRLNFDMVNTPVGSVKFIPDSTSLRINGRLQCSDASILNLDQLTSFNGVININTWTSFEFPAGGAYTVYSETDSESVENNVDILAFSGWKAATESSGVMTVSATLNTFSANSETVTDIDWSTNMTQDGLPLIVLRNTHASNSFTLTHNASKLRTVTGSNVTVGPYESVTFVPVSTTIVQQIAGSI